MSDGLLLPREKYWKNINGEREEGKEKEKGKARNRSIDRSILLTFPFLLFFVHPLPLPLLPLLPNSPNIPLPSTLSPQTLSSPLPLPLLNLLPCLRRQKFLPTSPLHQNHESQTRQPKNHSPCNRPSDNSRELALKSIRSLACRGFGGC